MEYIALVWKRKKLIILLLSVIVFILSGCGDTTVPILTSSVPTLTSSASPSPILPTMTTTEKKTVDLTPSINNTTKALPIPAGLSDITTKLPPGYLSDLKKQYPNGNNTIESVRIFAGEKDGCAITYDYHKQIIVAGWTFVLDNGSNQPIVSSGGTCRGIYEKDKVRLDVGGINLVRNSGPPIDFYKSIAPEQREGVKKAIGNAQSLLVIYILQAS